MPEEEASAIQYLDNYGGKHAKLLFYSSYYSNLLIITAIMKIISIFHSKIIVNSDFPMVMTLYLAIMARVLIVNQNVFNQVIQELNSPRAFEQLLDVWIAKMASVTSTDKRKLLGKYENILNFKIKKFTQPTCRLKRFGIN